ncbi:MAG: MliC family protein [Prevotellaceae bacterium]|jgi:membrane-bound inhibitor of C-type lysozyme|nr:MliC family protein [Prevotellaceae bacterium]
MKKMVFMAAIVASLGLMMASCNKGKEKSAQEDEIVTGVITNAEGVSLHYMINNTQGIAAFVLNGDTIKMKQEPMASGIMYRNDEYTYTEWQGNITLLKGEIVVFEKTNQAPEEPEQIPEETEQPSEDAPAEPTE